MTYAAAIFIYWEATRIAAGEGTGGGGGGEGGRGGGGEEEEEGRGGGSRGTRRGDSVGTGGMGRRVDRLDVIASAVIVVERFLVLAS